MQISENKVILDSFCKWLQTKRGAKRRGSLNGVLQVMKLSTAVVTKMKEHHFNAIFEKVSHSLTRLFTYLFFRCVSLKAIPGNVIMILCSIWLSIWYIWRRRVGSLTIPIFWKTGKKAGCERVYFLRPYNFSLYIYLYFRQCETTHD